MALIPPNYLNTIVSIEVEVKDGKGTLQKSSIATGFLVGNPQGKNNEQGHALFNLFLVTNRHVFQSPATKQYLKEVFFRFNTLDNKSHYFKVSLLKADGTPLWFMHSEEKIDLAVLPINGTKVTAAKINFAFFHGKDLFYAKDFGAKNISIGDGLYVLGFPNRLNGKARNFVILRQGIIARVDEEVLGEGYYYIDSSAYPGNSGGPVIVKPEIMAIEGTKSNPSAGLIGVISKGESYTDVAISQQTGEARVIFKEQMGLIRVVPVEHIFEIISSITALQKTEEAKVEDAGSEKNEDTEKPVDTTVK